MTVVLPKAQTLAALPAPCPKDLRSQIRAMVAARPDHKLVVLDDDPTGTQTVRDLPVLTTWDVPTLRAEFAQPGPCFYILTNSRSVAPGAVLDLNRTLARNLKAAAGLRSQFTLVSRSDSTLRGHYPLETDVLTEELGPFDATILVPYLEAGGRYTINDVHYVAEGDRLVPAAETPFARDAVFGYRQSNLREWVEEKTSGRVKAEAVVSFSIPELRTRSGPQEPTRDVFRKLLSLPHVAVAIVNGAAPADAEFFALATLEAERAGRRYLFRTAAQFVSARLGLEPRPLLTPTDLALPQSGGGLIVVGSYVPNTTEQLTRLLASTDIARVELAVDAVMDETSTGAALADATRRVDSGLRAGQNVALFTSRQLVTGADGSENLRIGQRVSAALVEIVSHLSSPPRFFVAKGGITASDLATKAFGVGRAMVRGQILPGVPVWQLGPESRFPGLNYIVFPGNVGGPEALTQLVQILTPSGDAKGGSP
jgi:uncharacterized protein YgbK (DUF1537 family)